jgi:type VI secretion system secreted protein VgrG
MAESVGPVTMDGPASGLEFRSMVGVEQLSQPFRYDVEFLSDIDMLEPNSFLGEPMTVHLELKEGALRHFNGIITDFSLRGHVGKKALYAVTLRPLLWLLTQRINSKIHKGTAVQIVKAVCADAPYADAKVEVKEGPLDDVEPNYEFVVQHEESDFNFVMRMLERDGIYFYFEHMADKHSLVLTTSDAYTVEKYGTLEFTVAQNAPQKQQEYVDQFVRHSALTPGTFAIHDFDYTATKNPLLVEVPIPRAHSLGEFEVFHFPGGYVDTEFGRTIARRRLEALQVSGERFDGQGNARCLGAGQLFSLIGHPEDTVNTDYMVYSVSFTLRTHDHQSGGALPSSDVIRANFVALDRAKPFRPPLRTPKPRILGVQSAVVVGPEGQEIETDPDGFGRVKVKFHWDRSGVKDGSNCCWIRVSQPWAGSNFGIIFTPRIGQEVLVEFLNGDPDLPVITGRVYNNDHMPPYTLPDNNTQSGIKTQSSLWGGLTHFNEIRFEDKLGSEELFVQAEKTHTVTVKGSRSVTVGGTQSTSVTGKETRDYKAERHTDVKGKDSLKVTDGDKTTDVDKLYEIKTKLGFKVADDTSTKAELASKKILLDAPDEIKLKVGSTEIILKPDSIELKSKTITMTGATSVKVTGAPNTFELDAKGATLTSTTEVVLVGPIGIKLNS